MSDLILTHRGVEKLLGLPRGRVMRLAREGLIPHAIIPSFGKAKPEFRFNKTRILEWIDSGCPPSIEEVPA